MSTVLKYAKVSEIKSLLDIHQNEREPEIEEAAAKAEGTVESALRPYASAIPLAGAELVTDIKYAANAKACALFSAIIRNFDLAKFWNHEFDMAILRIIPALQAIPTNQSNKGIVYASEYRTEPLHSRED